MVLLDIVKKRKVFDLYKFLDIYYYISFYLNEINFDKLIEEIKLFNAENYVYFALKNLSEIFCDFGNGQDGQIIYLIKTLEKDIKDFGILNTIFDQYNKNEIFISDINIKDRIFEYNVINKYTKGRNNEKFNS